MKIPALYIIALISNLYQPTKVVFDIPALNHKNITQIKKILGKPKYEDMPTSVQIQAGVTGDAYFYKDGFVLEVTYNPINKRVNDFFISKESSVSDYKQLEVAGNILNLKNFILNPIRDRNHPSLYTGVTITPR